MNKLEYPATHASYSWNPFFNHYELPILMICVKRDLFEILAKEGPLTCEEIYRKAKLGKRGGPAVLLVLASLGYVHLVDGKYYLSQGAQEYFTRSSPFFFGHVTMWEETLSKASGMGSGLVGKIEELLEKDYNAQGKEPEGHQIMKLWTSGDLNIEQAKWFASLMQGHLPNAINVAGQVQFKKSYGVSKLLDIGGGSGVFSIAIAKRQPDVHCTIFELPAAAKVAEEYIKASDLHLTNSKVDVYPGNMFIDTLPSGYQGVFMSNILHDWDDQSIDRVLGKIAKEALSSGGYLFLHEALINESLNGPLFSAYMNFHMFVCTAGRQFTLSELRAMLRKHGFETLTAIPAYNDYSVVVARKI